jgi:uncharacterized membrane protein YdfJ with MMPL/SSD domain
LNQSRNLAARAARWSAQHRKKAIFGWLAFMVVAFALGNGVGQSTIHGADQFSGESGRAEHTLQDAGLRPNSEHVFIQSKKLTVKDPRFQAVIRDAQARLSRTKHVTNVVPPPRGGAVSADGHSALVDFEITGDSVQGEKRLDPAKATVDAVAAQHPNLFVKQFGDVSTNKELNDIFSSDLGKAEMLSFPLTLFVLILAFGSLVAAFVPLLMGITTVMAALGLVALPSHLLPLDGNISSVILLIGLAVAVDYSLFYVRREREERAAGRSDRSALDIAAATSGRAVLISGSTVIAAMAGMFLSGDKTFVSFAEGTILVVAIAVLGSVTVLPAVLAWLGDRIEKGRVPIIGRNKRARESRFWSAVAGGVMRRPVVAIVLAGGLLVALAIPALSMNITTSGPDDLPQSLSLIKTYNKVKTAFPKDGVVANVAVKAPNVHSRDVAAGIAGLRRQAAQQGNVLPGGEVKYSKDGTVAEVIIPTKGNGNNAQSIDALNTIRDDIIPATVGSVGGVTVNTSGDAADSKDFSDLLSARLPLIFAFVFALTFLLLLWTFRSIVIPIKAIVLNLLSVGAAYGVLVLIFQDGRLEKLLGFNSNGGITNWLPLFLFVILFGLSMDYHVFILSRIREAHHGGMTTTEAVKHGIATTSGTVTSAAIVMVVVFSVFVTLTFLDFKEMGVGLAVAVLLDATIVRGVLLPASMRLLGDWNWYLPSWLEWIPHAHDVEPRGPEAPRLPAEPALH